MYWIRDIDVLAGGKKFQSLGENALEIDFDIPFNDKEEPDVSEVTIYNLSEDSINEIKKQGYCIVNAGYREMGNKACVVSGDIEDVTTDWEGLDKVAKIKVSDGGKEWRQAKLNKTYAEGTKASLIMQDLCGVLGYEVVEIKPKEDITYKLGKTIKGYCSDNLKRLVKDTKSKMYINKKRITIRDEKKGNDIGFLLNTESGLVGNPTLNKDDSEDKTDLRESEKEKKKNKEEKKTWKVTCLLNAKIETDSIIKIESKTCNGQFRVVSGKHTKDFNTELVVEEA
ncbi:MAG: hypothetical protein E7B42_01150 [Peptoniphilus harei]|nr:hypothetical protein [Peptoniphilus harei]